MAFLDEAQQDARENALHDLENDVWQQDQKNPINLVKELIEWMNEENESKFDQLTWSTESIDSLVENLENLGIWFAEKVNPYSISSSWDDTLNPLIEAGRIARICSFICQARKINHWKKVIDQFTKARAELELQDFKKRLEPYYE